MAKNKTVLSVGFEADPKPIVQAANKGKAAVGQLAASLNRLGEGTKRVATFKPMESASTLASKQAFTQNAPNVVADVDAQIKRASALLQQGLPQGYSQALAAAKEIQRVALADQLTDYNNYIQKKQTATVTAERMMASKLAAIDKLNSKIAAEKSPVRRGNMTAQLNAEYQALERLVQKYQSMGLGQEKIAQATQQAFTAATRAVKAGKEDLAKITRASEKAAADAARKAAKDTAAEEKRVAAEAKQAQKQYADAVRQTERAHKDLNRAISQVGKSGTKVITGLFYSLKDVVNGTRYVTQGFQEIGRTLLISVVAPLGLVLKSGFQAAVDFEAAMIRVRKVTSEKVDISWLTDQIKEISKYTPSSQVELAGFAEQLGQLGVDDQNAIVRLMVTMERLQVATDLTAESVTEDIGRIANAFGWDLNAESGVKNVERLANVINFLENKTAASAKQIVAGMNNAAQIGPMLKLEARDVAAMVSYVIAAGTNAEAAGTRISRWYTSALSKGSDFAKMMVGFKRDYGDWKDNPVTPYASEADVMKTLNDEPLLAFTDALAALNSVVDEDRAEMLRKYMDTFGLVGGKTAAAAQQFEKLQEMVSTLNGEWAGGDSLVREYNQALTSTDAQMKMLNNNIRDVGILMGNSVLPVLNKLIVYVIPAIQMLGAEFKKLPPNIQLLVVGIPILVVALTPLIFIFSSLFHAISLIGMGLLGIIPIFFRTAGSILGFGKAVIGVGKALAGLRGAKAAATVASVGTSAVKSSRAVLVLGKVFDFIKKGAVGFGGVVVKVFGWLGRVAPVVFGGIGTAGRVAFVAIKGAIVALGGALGGAFTAIGAAIAPLLPYIAVALAVVAAVVLVVNIVKKHGADIAKFFTDLASKAAAWGTNLITSWGKGIARGFTAVVNFVKKGLAFIARFFESHSPPELGPLKNIDDWGTNVMRTYLEGFAEADFGILSEIGNTIKSILNTAVGAGQLDEGLLQEYVREFRSGLSQLIAVFNQTGEISEELLGSLGNGLGVLGDDVKELIRLWLQYNQIQKAIKAIEDQRKQVTKDYSANIRAIAEDETLTAEEKAAAMREAMLGRDEQLAALNEEEEALKDQSDQLKGQLDWQKAFIDAQVEQLDLFAEIADKLDKIGGSLEDLAETDFSGFGIDTSGITDPVKEMQEQISEFQAKIKQAKEDWDIFLQGFNGGEKPGFKPPDLLTDGAPFVVDVKEVMRMREIYDKGVEIRGIWDDIKSKFDEVVTKIGEMADAFKPVSEFFTGFQEHGLDYLMDPSKFKTNGTEAGAELAAGVEEGFTTATSEIDFSEALLSSFSGAALDANGMPLNGLGRDMAMAFQKDFQQELDNNGKLDWSFLTTDTTLNTDLTTAISNAIAQATKGAGTEVEGEADSFGSAFLSWILSAETHMGTLGDGLATQITGTEQPKAVSAVEQFVNGLTASFRTMAIPPIVFQYKFQQVGAGLPSGGTVTSTNPPYPGGRDGNPATPYPLATGGIVTKPLHALIGEGAEPEVVSPLSKLPALFQSLYGDDMIAEGGFGGGDINITVGSVRSDKDIDDIARAVERGLQKKASSQMRYGRRS